MSKLSKQLFVVFFFSLLNAQSRDASFSRDGSKIIFVSKTGKISQVFSMNTDGSQKRQITHLDANSFYPFISVDNKIVFMNYPNAKATICTINLDGSGFKRLTDESEENADPHWSPNGEKIIFYSERDGNNEIYMMNMDGSEWRRLTNHPASDQTPSIAPNGEKIVFVSDRDGNAELYTMDINGEHVSRLTLDPRSDRVPAWSADSKHIVWYSRENPEVAGSAQLSWNGAELYMINTDGSERKQLTHNLWMDHGPVFSPDGQSLLFTSGRSGNREVWMMSIDGSMTRQLTFNSK
ncbi:MAG: PD40 domain-containing protein [Calditrichaeota bacterium]|nr:PD40 domain-containing protein [Calditrichota bacterium]